MKRIAYLFFTLFILASCGQKTTSDKKNEELTKLKKERAEIDKKIAALEIEVNKNNPGKATSVSVMELQPETFKAFVDVQAQITSDDNILATPQMMGIVKNIFVHVGQQVTKGQILAQLDAAAVEQQIKAQAAQLSLLKQLYEKQQKLWAQNIGTQVQLLQAKTQYESALSQNQALVAQRDMYTITAPISGVVDDLGIKVGDAAAPGAAGIRIVNKNKLKATGNVGENYIGKVHQGDPVILVFPDLGDSINTHVTYVSQSVDPISRAFTVEVKLANTKQLKPNMSCKMKIVNYENKNALVVPVSVIQKTSGGDMLFIADGNKAKSVIITSGENANGMVEVKEGLKQGDKVITAGYQELDNGDNISIQ